MCLWLEAKKFAKPQKCVVNPCLQCCARIPCYEKPSASTTPLAECLINEDWEDQKFATIYISRHAPAGLVLGAFRVDLAGMGLKACWGKTDLIEADIKGSLISYSQRSEFKPDFEAASFHDRLT